MENAPPRLAAPALCAVLALLLPAAALAGTVSIRSDMRLVSGPWGLDVALLVTNDGDETARTVSSTLLAHGKTFQGPEWDAVASGETVRAAFNIPHPKAARGRYPLVLTTRYSDAAGRSFSAVHVTPYRIREDKEPGIQAFMDIFVLRDQDPLRVHIQNPTEKPKDIALKLVTPWSFGCGEPERRVRLKPGELTVPIFDMLNRHASPGDVLPFFLVAEFQEDGLNHTLVLEDMATVDEPERFFTTTRKIWTAAACTAFFAFLVLALAARRRRTHGQD
jgi:hypothetical protein